MFYDSHTSERTKWVTMTVDSEKSPRTNKESIQNLKDKYGEDSNVVRVRVHGLFPLAEDDVFIPISLIEQSINTDIKIKSIPDIIDIGVDVARFGDDKTIISYRVDGQVKIYNKYHGQDTMSTANKVVLLYNLLRMQYKEFKKQENEEGDDKRVSMRCCR